MTTILLWAVFLAFVLLVVLAPVARWFARLAQGGGPAGAPRRRPRE